MKQLHKQWSSILVRGIFSCLFGILAIFWPGFGLELLVLIFGAYALIDGIIAAAIGLSIQSGLLFVEGVIGVIVGAIIFMFTPQAVVLFLFLVGAWAILTGILEIIAAFELGKYIKHEIYLLIVGLSSIILGILVYINPLVAGYAITIVIGIYALIFGSFLTVMAFKLKDYRPKTAKRRR